jgi:hypothetical protein
MYRIARKGIATRGHMHLAACALETGSIAKYYKLKVGIGSGTRS